MQKVRKLLVKVIGLEKYLQLVSSIYLRMMKLGFFKQKYAELHFIKSVIKPTDTVLDIGANLGYYSYFMAVNVQEKGRLLAVEPIPLFASIWRKNLKKFDKKNITLLNCALGTEKQDAVSMSIPIVNGVVRHGLTKIDSGNSTSDLSFQVPMNQGDQLIAEADIAALNYIKCDVEGYEQYVIPSLNGTINQFKPLIQIELNGVENRDSVLNFLFEKHYNLYILDFNKLKSISKDEIHTFNQDFYFIHPDKLSNYNHLIIQK